MPMPIRYHVRNSRPRNRVQLTGTLWMEGMIFISGEEVYLAQDVDAGTVFGYLLPTSLFALDYGKVPRSLIKDSIVFMNSRTHECLYHKIKSISPHFTHIMRYTHDMTKANCYIDTDTSIRSLKPITPTRNLKPVILTCYYNQWSIAFSSNPYMSF